MSTIGILVRTFNLQNVRVPDARTSQYNGIKLPYSKDKALYKSSIGTPVFADVTLLGGAYTDQSGKRIEYPEIRLETVLLTVDFAAKIIKTEIQGRKGTVKEYIGEDDAKVTIQGVLTGPNGVYPADQVANLNRWRMAPVAKKAVSRFLQNLGIDELVVEDCSFPQVAGGYSYQQFTINCISDLPVELKITNNV